MKRGKKEEPERRKKRAPKKRSRDEVSKEAAAKIDRIIARGLEELEALSFGGARSGKGVADPNDVITSVNDFPWINLAEFDVAPDVIKLVPRAACEEHVILPVARGRTTLILAMADPMDLGAVDHVRLLTGLDIEPVGASLEAILAAIERYYAK